MPTRTPSAPRIPLFLLLLVAFLIILVCSLTLLNLSYADVSQYLQSIETTVEEASTTAETERAADVWKRLDSSMTYLPESSIFIFRAYYDSRFNDVIRVLYLADCDEAPRLRLFLNNAPLESSVAPIEGECPWHWAPTCRLSSHVLTAVASGVSPDDIVCVPPLYWYTNWPKLLVFIELWRQQNVTHFHVYYHSVSATVLQLLRHYEGQGILTAIPWPELPKSNEYDPNESVYRLAHSIAHNDCLRRTRGSFTALVDVDEFVLTRSRKDGSRATLLEFLRLALVDHPHAGSFRFAHRQLSFVPLEVDEGQLDFSGIHRAFITNLDGPKKVVFIPSRTLVLNTHSVREHRYPYGPYQVDVHEALLYHARDNWAREEPNDTRPIADLFPRSHVRNLQANARRIMQDIFEGTPPPFDGTIPRSVAECLEKDVDEWVFARPENTFVAI